MHAVIRLFMWLVGRTHANGSSHSTERRWRSLAGRQRDGTIFAYAVSYDWSKGSEHYNPRTNHLLLHPVPETEIKSRAARKEECSIWAPMRRRGEAQKKNVPYGRKWAHMRKGRRDKLTV